MSAYYHHEGHVLSRPEELPDGDTHAVLQPESYSTDHGYPEHGSSTEHYIQIVVFPNRERWLSFIEAHEKEGSRFGPKKTIVPVIIRKTKMTVTIAVEVPP